MRELGEAHERAHREVGSAAAEVVDELVIVGVEAGGIATGAAALGDRVVVVRDREAAIPVLRQRLRHGDAVLVKASRGVALESIVETLQTSFGGWTAGADAQGGARPTGEEVW